MNNDEVVRFDFKASKRGRITELVVTKEYRKKHIGKKLLDSMNDYLKSISWKFRNKLPSFFIPPRKRGKYERKIKNDKRTTKSNCFIYI